MCCLTGQEVDAKCALRTAKQQELFSTVMHVGNVHVNKCFATASHSSISQYLHVYQLYWKGDARKAQLTNQLVNLHQVNGNNAVAQTQGRGKCKGRVVRAPTNFW